MRAAPGVVAVLTPADIPGKNDISPFAGDDPLFAEGEVKFMGQPLFAVAAESLPKARAAAALAVVEYEDLPVLINVADARAADTHIEPTQVMRLGDAAAALAVVDYQDLPARLTIAEARAADTHLEPTQVMRLGDARAAKNLLIRAFVESADNAPRLLEAEAVAYG